MGVLPHLGENAARYLPEGDFRIVVWSTPVWLVQNGRWREVVAQRQRDGLPSWVRRGCRRRAREERQSVQRSVRCGEQGQPRLVGTDLLKVARYIFRLTFGVLAVFLGLGIIGWMCYNEFNERLPQYGGFHWWEPF